MVKVTSLLVNMARSGLGFSFGVRAWKSEKIQDLKCFKMLPVTELKNIPDATFDKST